MDDTNKKSRFKIKINPKILYLLPLIFPIVLWILGAITLHYYLAKLLKYQKTLASILLPVLIGLFIIITIHFVLVAWRKCKGKTKIKRPTRFAQVTFTSLSILFMLAMGYLIAPHFAAIHFNSGPALTWGSGQDPATGISIMWKTAGNAETRVWLGENTSSMAEYTVSGPQSQWHKISIDGLQPNTTYYYSIPNFRNYEVFSFKTAPTGPSNFSFLVFADARQNDGEFAVPLLPNLPKYMDEHSQELGVDPAFTFIAGDFVGEAYNIATWKTWFDDISTSSNLATTRPMAYAIGNHERHDDFEGNMVASILPLENKPGFYYSFNYSQLHVTVLDPWNASIGGVTGFNQAQMDWAISDLTNASSMDYKIICLHFPPISRDGTTYGHMTFVTELCMNYSVDAVFFGDTHDYAVNLVNGTWYFLIGVGGNFAEFWAGTGYAQVDVTTVNMIVSMNWMNGTREQLCTIPA